MMMMRQDVGASLGLADTPVVVWILSALFAQTCLFSLPHVHFAMCLRVFLVAAYSMTRLPCRGPEILTWSPVLFILP